MFIPWILNSTLSPVPPPDALNRVVRRFPHERGLRRQRFFLHLQQEADALAGADVAEDFAELLSRPPILDLHLGERLGDQVLRGGSGFAEQADGLSLELLAAANSFRGTDIPQADQSREAGFPFVVFQVVEK